VDHVAVLAEVAHDPAWFTQGLDIREEEGRLVVYESTGLYGQSKLLRWDLESGRVLNEASLEPSEFGEGLAVVGSRVLQLLWQTRRVVVWDKATWTRTGELLSPMQDGWGLAHEPEMDMLAGTDGSSRLYLMDPATLELRRAVEVHDEGRPVAWLNEVEWVKGEVWANVWQTDCVARIDPSDGHVRGWLVLGDVHERMRSETGGRAADVLNGIALTPAGDVWVTGKLWPRMYRVEVEREASSHKDLTWARKLCIPT